MIESIFEIGASMAQVFLMVWFMSNFCGYKYDGVRKYIGFISVFLFDFLFITYITSFIIYDGLISIISVIASFIYASICLKGNIYKHIFAPVFCMVLIFTLSNVFIQIMSNIFNKDIAELMGTFSYQRIIILVGCRVVEYATFKTILYMKTEYKLTNREWLLFAFTAFLTWIEITQFTNASLAEPAINRYMLAASVAAVFVNILLYYFIVKISKDAEVKTELALLKMQHDNVRNTEENMKILYDSIHSVKHDLEKHFLCVRALEEKGEGNKAIEYIDSVIGKQLNSAYKTIMTDNDVFNAIMNVRLEICHHKGIYPSINIEKNAIDLLDAEDVVVLFGNILDNAIEAAEKTENKIIMLNIQRQGEYVSIYMENSFDGKFDSALVTNKKNKQEHGFGLKNVRKIVEKYDGMLKCFSDGDMFCCDILLKTGQM